MIEIDTVADTSRLAIKIILCFMRAPRHAQKAQMARRSDVCVGRRALAQGSKVWDPLVGGKARFAF